MPLESTEGFFAGLSLAPELAGVTMRLGADQLSIGDVAPRIVWTTPAEGEERYARATWLAGDGNANPPRPWYRVGAYKAHVWGPPADTGAPGFDPTEDLLNNLFSALEGQKWGGYWYDAPRGGWAKQGTDRGTELLKFGRCYVLIVDIWIPVITTAQGEAKITDMPITEVIDHL